MQNNIAHTHHSPYDNLAKAISNFRNERKAKGLDPKPTKSYNIYLTKYDKYEKKYKQCLYKYYQGAWNFAFVEGFVDLEKEEKNLEENLYLHF